MKKDTCSTSGKANASAEAQKGGRSYQYTPMKDAQHEIRLLHILPGGLDDEIQCELHHAALDDKLSYQALSYSWGRTVRNKTISIDGCSGFRVTDNLGAALRRLRYTDATRILWIDAVCINQADLAERSQQVMLMGSLYRAATDVTVWLGDADVVFHLDLTDAKSTATQYHDWRMHCLRAAITDTRPSWWKRTWVVQEYANAWNSVLYQFGPHMLSESELFALLSSMKDPGGQTDAYSLDADGLYYALRWFQQVRAVDAPLEPRGLATFATLLFATQCADPRDKVYGVLSVIDPREWQAIIPDYDQTCAEVFARATYVAISANESISVLALNSFDRPRTVEMLPSWAVDFMCPWQPDDRYVVDPAHFIDERPQKFVSWSSDCEKPKLSSRAMCITTTGVLFDIMNTAINLPSWNSFRKNPERLSTLHDLYRRLSGLRPHEHHEDKTKSSTDKCQGLSHQFVELMARRTGHCEPAKLDAQDLAEEEELETFTEVLCAIFENWDYEFYGTLVNDFEVPNRELIMMWATHAEDAAGSAVFFVTATGFLGIAPNGMMPGDVVALLHGSNAPVLLRRIGEQYTFHGFAYVHGIMRSELETFGKDIVSKERNFALV